MFHTSHMRVDPAYREALREAGLGTVDAILGRNDGRVVAWSRTTDSVYIPTARGVGFYVKRYFYPSWRARFRTMLRGTFLGIHRGKAEYRSLSTMRSYGINAVRPVAYGSQRLGHFVTACFLVTEEVPHAPNLTTYAQELEGGRREVTPAWRHKAARRLATQISEMHGRGYEHGRLFWRNVLIRRDVLGEPEFFFLDAERQKRIERIGRAGSWRMHELAKVATSAEPFSSRTDRVRFLRAYLGVRRLDAAAKVHVRELSRLMEHWARHERQRIRMNARFEQWNRLLAEEADGDPRLVGGTR